MMFKALMNLFSAAEASSVGVIGGSDGPTAIFVAAADNDLLKALSLTWKGMLGIFTVMVVIALIVRILPGLTSVFEKKKDK